MEKGGAEFECPLFGKVSKSIPLPSLFTVGFGVIKKRAKAEGLGVIKKNQRLYGYHSSLYYQL